MIIENQYRETISNMSTSVVCSPFTNGMETMAAYYPQYQTYNCAIIDSHWNSIVGNMHVPALYASAVTHVIPVLSTQIFTPVCPCTGTIVTEPIVADISNTVITDIIPAPCGCNPEVFCGIAEEYSEVMSDEIENVGEMTSPKYMMESVTDDMEPNQCNIDPIEFYFSLPKELFPTARMFTYDPNPIIDEFCKMADALENIHWILDLEFGIPRVAVTRTIAVYDVKCNSVHCKNTPNAIHPGFEKCTSDFKRVVLFYYDCIVSAWYKGYIIMNQDKSVENFQAWLLLPMQIFGMAWR